MCIIKPFRTPYCMILEWYFASVTPAFSPNTVYGERFPLAVKVLLPRQPGRSLLCTKITHTQIFSSVLFPSFTLGNSRIRGLHCRSHRSKYRNWLPCVFNFQSPLSFRFRTAVLLRSTITTHLVASNIERSIPPNTVNLWPRVIRHCSVLLMNPDLLENASEHNAYLTHLRAHLLIGSTHQRVQAV